MITSVCLNPSIDRTVQVQGFAVGATNRILREQSEGRGKGVNVALTASALGLQTCCTGLLGEDNARLILEPLERLGVRERFVRQRGAVRTNLKIQDVEHRAITELNEPGAPVQEEGLVAVAAQVEELAQKSEYLVLTGSLPPGCPASIYRMLMLRVAGSKCRCVLDASGASLTDGILGRPFLVKPNLQELEQAAGCKLTTLREIRTQALDFIAQGVQIVVVSMGAGGALLTDGRTTLYAPSLPVGVYSTVGAGDAMVAGLIRGFGEGMDLKEALRCGVAAAAAAVSSERGCLFERSAYEQLLSRVDVGRV